MDLNNISEQVLKLTKSGEPFVLVTLVNIKGSAPQNLGARMLVTPNGIHCGTVGGGKVEAHCLNYAQEILKDEKQLVASEAWNLQTDIGMTCGGVVQFLFEKIQQTKWSIAIMGAGHVTQALVPVLLNLDCALFVFDQRQEWIDKLPDNPKLKKYRLDQLDQALDHIPKNSFVCSMTMGHAHDAPILKRALREFNFPFYGVIGSLKKRNALVKELGLTDDDHFYCPIGEDFGTNDPAEIALSIGAQLLKKRDQYFATS